MGYSSHSADKLGPPWLLVDEAVFVVPKGGVLRINKHHFKFLLILNGTIEHEIEGLPGRRPLAEGDILAAPVVGWHEYINTNEEKAVPMQAIRIFLDADFLAARAKRRNRKPESDLADFILHHFHRVSQLRNAIDNEFTGLIHAYRRETERAEPGFRHQVRAICTQLIVAIARKLGAPGGSRTVRINPAGQIVAAAREYILKHAFRELTLGEIAWHVGKGEEHLARVFKRQTGQSVFDYVREIRINHAKTLLLNPALTLTQIGGRCGFQSLSYFSRTFRQQAGMSPTEFRRHSGSVLSAGPLQG